MDRTRVQKIDGIKLSIRVCGIFNVMSEKSYFTTSWDTNVKIYILRVEKLLIIRNDIGLKYMIGFFIAPRGTGHITTL